MFKQAITQVRRDGVVMMIMMMIYTVFPGYFSFFFFPFFFFFKQVLAGRHLGKFSLDDGQRRFGVPSKTIEEFCVIFLTEEKIVEGNKGKTFLPVLKSGTKRQMSKRMKEELG